MTPSRWLDDVKARTDVPTVARELGLSVKANEVGPCPACDAEQRGSTDKRLPVGFNAKGWTCHRCKITGDAVNLATLVLFGRRSLRDLSREQVGELRAWCAGKGYCYPDEHGMASTPSPQPRARLLPPKPTAPTSYPRPPADELAALWAACVPVVQDDQVATWLHARGLQPELVADEDAARALPPDHDVPRWAEHWLAPGRPPLRCVLPCYGPQGALESLRARALLAETTAKSRGTQGLGTGQTKNLALADKVGRHLLRHGNDPAHWPDGKAPRRLVVAEGEPSFLTWLCRAATDPACDYAVLGLWAGSWTDELAARVPTGTVVVVRTDRDEQGDKYARQVNESLAGRCEVLRAVPGGGQ